MQPIQDLVELKRSLRAQRFVALQEQITNSVYERVERHNAGPNSFQCAIEQQASKSATKIFITATSNQPRQLIVIFKADKDQVRIQSEQWDYTIEVRNIEPASTVLARRQARTRSWSVLEDVGVERMLDAAFNAAL